MPVFLWTMSKRLKSYFNIFQKVQRLEEEETDCLKLLCKMLFKCLFMLIILGHVLSDDTLTPGKSIKSIVSDLIRLISSEKHPGD
jgi:hypothetical protein